MDYNSFANRIKEKYPQYKDMDNRVLSEKIVSKYPQYKETVTFDDIQPQAPKLPSMESMPEPNGTIPTQQDINNEPVYVSDGPLQGHAEMRRISSNPFMNLFRNDGLSVSNKIQNFGRDLSSGAQDFKNSFVNSIARIGHILPAIYNNRMAKLGYDEYANKNKEFDEMLERWNPTGSGKIMNTAGQMSGDIAALLATGGGSLLEQLGAKGATAGLEAMASKSAPKILQNLATKNPKLAGNIAKLGTEALEDSVIFGAGGYGLEKLTGEEPEESLGHRMLMSGLMGQGFRRGFGNVLPWVGKKIGETKTAKNISNTISNTINESPLLSNTTAAISNFLGANNGIKNVDAMQKFQNAVMGVRNKEGLTPEVTEQLLRLQGFSEEQLAQFRKLQQGGLNINPDEATMNAIKGNIDSIAPKKEPNLNENTETNINTPKVDETIKNESSTPTENANTNIQEQPQSLTSMMNELNGNKKTTTHDIAKMQEEIKQASEQATAKRRGRPKGSKNKPKQQTQAEEIKSINEQSIVEPVQTPEEIVQNNIADINNTDTQVTKKTTLKQAKKNRQAKQSTQDTVEQPNLNETTTTDVNTPVENKSAKIKVQKEVKEASTQKTKDIKETNKQFEPEVEDTNPSDVTYSYEQPGNADGSDYKVGKQKTTGKENIYENVEKQPYEVPEEYREILKKAGDKYTVVEDAKNNRYILVYKNGKHAGKEVVGRDWEMLQKQFREARNKSIKADEGNVSDDVLEQSQRETYEEDYIDNTSSEIQQGLHSENTTDVEARTKYKDNETGKFIESLQGKSTKEQTNEIINKFNDLDRNPEKIDELIQKVYEESDYVSPGRNVIGEENKTDNGILDVVDALLKAKKEMNIGKAQKETFFTTGKQRKNADRKWYNFLKEDKNGYENQTEFDALESKIQEADKKGDKATKAKLIKEKKSLQRSDKKSMFENPREQVKRNIDNAKNKEEAINSYLDRITDPDYVRWNKADAKVLYNDLKKMADKHGIKLKRNLDEHIKSQGKKVMQELKALNEEGDLNGARELLDNNKSLLKLNENKKYEDVYFDTTEVSKHYAQSTKKAISSIAALRRGGEARKSELISITEEKRANYLKMAEKNKHSKEKIDKKMEMFDKSVEKIKNSSPAVLEREAIARAREIYAANRRIIRRNLVDYSKTSTNVYDRDGNYEGRHYFEHDVEETYNPEEKFQVYDNAMKQFLDQEHWDGNPWEEKVYQKKDLSDLRKKLNDARDKYYTNLEDNGKIINGSKYTYKVKTIEESVSKIESKIKRKQKLIDETNNKAQKAKNAEEIKELEQELDIIKNHLQLEKDMKSLERNYNTSREMENIKSKAGDRLRTAKKNDNPFEKDWQDYYDSKTGKLDTEALKRDVAKMEDENYLRSKAMEKISIEGKAKDEGKLSNITNYKERKLNDVITEYKTKLNELKRDYEEELGTNYRDSNVLSSRPLSEAANDYIYSAFKEDFSKLPDVKLQVVNKVPDGATAKAIFDSTGKHKILIGKDLHDKAEWDMVKFNEIIEEELKHVKDFNDVINGKKSKSLLDEAFSASDKSHKLYNKNGNVFDVISDLIHKGINPEEVVSSKDIAKYNNWQKSIKEQNEVTLEKEAKNGPRRSNEENNRLEEKNGRENDSRPTGDISKTVSSKNDGNTDTRGREDLSRFNGKSLDHIEPTEQKQWYKETFDTDKEPVWDKDGKVDKDVLDAYNFWKEYADASEKRAIDNDLLEVEQAANRLAMKNAGFYMPEVGKGSKTDGSIDIGRDYAKSYLEKVGLDGLATKENTQAVNVQNAMALVSKTTQRDWAINTMKIVKDSPYTKPVVDGKIDKFHKGINEAVAKAALYGKKSTAFYETLMEGEDAIRHAFKDNPEVAEYWVNFVNKHKGYDYQIPEVMYRQMFSGYGETPKEYAMRYCTSGTGMGKVSDFARKTIKYAQVYNSVFLDLFKRNVLTSGTFIWNNRIGNQLMMAMTSDSPMEFVKSYMTRGIKDSDLPPEIFEHSITEMLGEFNARKVYTGDNGIDNFLNLFGGHTLTSENLDKMIKVGTVKGKTKYIRNPNFSYKKAAMVKAGNAFAHYNKGVNSLVGGLRLINESFENYERKVVFMRELNRVRKDMMKGNCQKMVTQMDALKHIKENPEVLDAVLKSINDTLGDYNNFSRLERDVIKQIVPFYSWTRTITRHMFKNAKKYPARYAMFAIEYARLMEQEEGRRKSFQKGIIPMNIKDSRSGEQLGLNFISTTANPFNLELPGMHPLISATKEAIEEKKTVGQWTSRKYAQKRIYENGTPKTIYVDKDGNKYDDIPITSRLGRVGTEFARHVFFTNNNTVNLEKHASALFRLAKEGKYELPDKLYDDSFGGYRHNDNFGQGIKRYSFNHLSNKTKLINYVAGNKIAPIKQLNKSEMKAIVEKRKAKFKKKK